MKHSNIAAAALLPMVSARLVDRQDGGNNDDSSGRADVCYPAFEESDDTRPPCVMIDIIESACQPNGTSSLHYEAHAACMCTGSFFDDWLGCQDCLVGHGYRSERDRAFWGNVISSASNALCTGVPTAAFQELFVSVQESVPAVTTGNTRSSDRFSSSTDVGLYYTATEPQGPGPITGDLTSATAESTAGADPTRTTGSETTTRTPRRLMRMRMRMRVTLPTQATTLLQLPLLRQAWPWPSLEQC
ncbi:hypothetical protein B0I35DRAFT_125977 [Stachybotrys elegans]|uniref:Uncharacterized protein n=1 Tax=Stachybotrys elegans TaxID=80388 RepID=A0A8K0WVE6_9HYPO|nr:hypothetical protein B0I35DRAFT_125977 [Stachybotrys elegans]